MYTGDAYSTVSQGNTLSSIQALLKNKEKCQISTKSLSVESSKDKGFLSNCATSDFSNLETKSQNFETDTKNSASPDHVSNNANSQESLDQQKDFNYSQKLFHIADGNLYSIFSPIQGRSYGMKPSFLRKQKYTVQECHNRGRKNLRKGLKFHNFLPSESVTSEKDNKCLSTKWKVHSECRLREEHGTKQITISNWSQSIQNPPAENANFRAGVNVPIPLPIAETVDTEPSSSFLKSENDNLLDCETNPDVNDPYDFNLNSLTYNSSENENVYLNLNRPKSEVSQKPATCSSSKKDSLDSVLNSLLQKSPIVEKSNDPDEIDNMNKSCHKHRRKPVQTRRVVPYVKYLSIMEESDVLPLDLSSKCLVESSSCASISSCEDSFITSGKIDANFSKRSSPIICDEIKNTITNYVHSHDSFFTPNMSSDKLMANSSLNQMIQMPPVTAQDILYPFNKTFNLKPDGLHPLSLQGFTNSKMEVNANQKVLSIPAGKSYKSITNMPNNSQFSVQKSLVKEVQSKPRKRNQRSVIKQKLEDSFRQNGFLVKTKQVSDGEATFCKFRQLRKYTRYYLKSLEQHLPDEFHKMWKGFLPPKTVLPPISGAPEPINEGL